MATHRIKVRSLAWHLRTQTLGEWSRDSIAKINGISDARIVEDGADQAVIEYECTPGGGTDRIDEILRDGGAERIWD